MTVFDNQTKEELINDIRKYCNDYDICQLESVYKKELKDFTKGELIKVIDELFD